MRHTLVSCQLVLASLLCGCGGVELVQNLTELQANRVVTALHRGGIQATKVKGKRGARAGYTITVERGDAVKAWQLLHRQNLPRPRQKQLKELLGAASLVATTRQRRALLQRALAAEIAKTLRSVDGVVDARVHLARPARPPLAPPGGALPRARASVLMRVSGPSPLSREQVQALVQGAVQGLVARDVSVVILATPRTPAAATPLAQVGPFAVAAASRTPLLVSGITGLLLVLGLGLAVLALVRRDRRQTARLAQLTEAREAGARTRSRDLESSLSLLDRSFSHRRTGKVSQKKSKLAPVDETADRES